MPKTCFAIFCPTTLVSLLISPKLSAWTVLDFCALTFLSTILLSERHFKVWQILAKRPMFFYDFRYYIKFRHKLTKEFSIFFLKICCGWRCLCHITLGWGVETVFKTESWHCAARPPWGLWQGGGFLANAPLLLSLLLISDQAARSMVRTGSNSGHPKIISSQMIFIWFTHWVFWWCGLSRLEIYFFQVRLIFRF